MTEYELWDALADAFSAYWREPSEAHWQAYLAAEASYARCLCVSSNGDRVLLASLGEPS